MRPNVPKEWLGELNWKSLFPDSKSEGVYPVLTTSNGQHYRVRLKDAPPEAILALRRLDGLQVKLEGHADDLRGHWRINVPWIEDGLTVQEVISPPVEKSSLPDEKSLNQSPSKDS